MPCRALLHALFVVFALAHAAHAAQSYLGASEETPAIVREYFVRRSGGDAAAAALDDEGLRAYVKPSLEDPPAGGASATRAPKPAPAGAGAGGADAAAQPRGRARRAAAAAAAASAPQLLEPRSWRGRVVNCLACGCVHDCRGADGGGDAMRAFLAANTCLHCGAPVPPDGAAAAPSRARAQCDDAAAAAAALQAARLVEFDRTSAQRSTVVDDQADHRDDVEGNAWISAAEKQARRAAAAKLEEEAAAERRRVRVTLDLVGRRVIEAPGPDAAPRAADEAELARRADAVRTCSLAHVSV